MQIRKLAVPSHSLTESKKMEFIINNVRAEKKYKGAYETIFSILNDERIFTEVYETEESIGLVGTQYFLTISETPSPAQLEKILKIKNVTIAN